MKRSEKKIDTGICSLCGNPNTCVMAGCSNPDTPCWCRHEPFPQALLDMVPPAARNRACICKPCLQAFRKTATD